MPRNKRDECWNPVNSLFKRHSSPLSLFLFFNIEQSYQTGYWFLVIVSQKSYSIQNWAQIFSLFVICQSKVGWRWRKRGAGHGVWIRHFFLGPWVGFMIVFSVGRGCLRLSLLWWLTWMKRTYTEVTIPSKWMHQMPLKLLYLCV